MNNILVSLSVETVELIIDALATKLRLEQAGAASYRKLYEEAADKLGILERPTEDKEEDF